MFSGFPHAYRSSPKSHHWSVSYLRISWPLMKLILMLHPQLSSFDNEHTFWQWIIFLRHIVISWRVLYYNVPIYFGNAITGFISIHCWKLKGPSITISMYSKLIHCFNGTSIFDTTISSDISDGDIRCVLLLSSEFPL